MTGQIVVATLLLLGTALGALAGLGLHRFDSLYARMHAATKPASLGLLLVLLATAIGLGDGGAAVKLALVALLQFVTAPIAGHAIARAAHRAGQPMGSHAVVDELREHEEEREGSSEARSGGVDGNGA